MKPKIFISSPYTIGDTAVNVRAQIDAADKLMDHGFTPFLPLLSHFQHMIHARPYDDWLRNDLEWLYVCDAVLRLPGESKGADLEVRHAKRLGLPVFYSVDDVLKKYA